MQLIITDLRLAKSRTLHFSGWKLAGIFSLLSIILVLASAALYHWVFLKGAREGWPVVGSLVRFVVRDEFEQRDRYLRENLDAMARKVGEMQAKLVQLESLGERVSGLAGISAAPIKQDPGRGGALVAGRDLSLDELNRLLADLNRQTEAKSDYLTVIESRLLEERVRTHMVPTQQPVLLGHLGSSFGWRIDPISGQSALHTGLDFQADPGTPIQSAAAGVVVTQEFHPAYGNLIEIDHGNDLMTRYAHASQVHVRKGEIVRRGQKIAEVGSTGRSTGPHLHFEVLVSGVPQDPQKFLAAGAQQAVALSKRGKLAGAPGARP